MIAPHYPTPKTEGWWLVVGDPETNRLLANKRVTIGKEEQVTINFVAPSQGDHDLKLYLMCDAYQGCDQEFEFQLHVLEGKEESSEEESGEED